MAADGTGLSMPDTEKNQARWPQSKNQKPGCGFPAINLVGVFCLLTGALVKAAYGDRRTHESTLFRDLWSAFNEGDLAVTDRGFFSFFPFSGLLSRGVDSFMRLPEKKLRKAISSQLPKTVNFDVVVNPSTLGLNFPPFLTDSFSSGPTGVDEVSEMGLRSRPLLQAARC